MGRQSPRESHGRVLEARRAIAAHWEWPSLFESARGVTLVDTAGREYLDFTSGYGVANAGWNHPAILRAMREQMERSCFAPPWAATEPALGLSDRLLSLVAADRYVCLRATGGGDAIEAVLRVLRAGHAGRARLLTFGRSYHGGGSEPLRLGDGKGMPLPQVRGDHVRSPAPYCLRCAWGKEPGSCALECAAHVARALDANDDIAAVILEPVIGSGGIIPSPRGYLARVSEICRERGVPLIVDEVMTGMGRCGAMLAHTTAGIRPDAIVLGKGLSSGCMPIGAALVRRDLWERAEHMQDVSSTFAWMPLACAAACASFDVIAEERLGARAAELGELLLSLLGSEVAPRLGRSCGQVRGSGLMVALELTRESGVADPRLGERIACHCHRLGLMVALSWLPNVLVLMPPLVISEEELRRGVALLAEAAERSVKVR